MAMHLKGVMVRDRENPEIVYTLHDDCADRVIEKVNAEIGYARLFIYGPGILDNCAATDCPHN